MNRVVEKFISEKPPLPGALSREQMQATLGHFPDYNASELSPGRANLQAVNELWGTRISPIMAAPQTKGRFAKAAIACPPTACTASLRYDPGAASQAWRNPLAQENIFCLDGPLQLSIGPHLEHQVTLERFDMVSVPANVRIKISNPGSQTVHTIVSLSAPTETLSADPFTAVFNLQLKDKLTSGMRDSLGVSFDDDHGSPIDATVLMSRVTRFTALVPYKKDLNRTGGLPPEATESLSASSVFPLIVPEGHIGRSRTAPMYGNQGLYISIAECKSGDDGPPPHSHSDTQETFFVLEGSFDICTGFDNESVIQARQFDIVSVPNKVQRAFINTSPGIARLLVLIQGPDRMQDTVWYSQRIGQDFERRFGREVIEHYAKIRMTFDAEERLSASHRKIVPLEGAPNHARTQRVVLRHADRSIPTCLWLPRGQPQALVMACHGGSGHKESTAIMNIVAQLRPQGIAVLAIDGPVHGDRAPEQGQDPVSNRVRFREAWKSGVGHTTMAQDFSKALDWALLHPALENVPVGYIGVSMGTAYGIPLLAQEKRIQAAAIGLWSTTYPHSDHLKDFATRIKCPVWFTQQWDDEFFDRAGTAELFDLIGSTDKRLVAYPGPHLELQDERLSDAVRFLKSRLAC